MILPTNQCLLTNPHGSHDWWYTSSGGGHMLSEAAVGDPLEKNQKQHHCPGKEGSNERKRASQTSRDRGFTAY